jgi:hypothetical protein
MSTLWCNIQNSKETFLLGLPTRLTLFRAEPDSLSSGYLLTGAMACRCDSDGKVGCTIELRLSLHFFFFHASKACYAS